MNSLLLRLFTLCMLLLTGACGGGGGTTPAPTPTNSPSPSPAPTPTPNPTPPVSYSASPHQSAFFGDQDLSQFFALFDHGQQPRIDIRISQSEWDAMLSELQANLKSEVYFQADATITTNDAATDISEIGFRIRGNTTRRLPEVSGQYRLAHFRIKFNETFDLVEGTLAYGARRDRRYANLRSLNLKTTTITNDVPQMRELYAYDLFNQVGVKAPLTNSARLFLHVGADTVDYGEYTIIEPIDKAFLRKRYGDINNEGNLYKCLWQAAGPATLEPFNVNDPAQIGVEDEAGNKPKYDLKTNETLLDHDALLAFVDTLNSLNGSQLKTYLDANFEIDKFIRSLAMNVLVGMPDDYWGMANNYYLYFNDAGKIEFFPYDYDHTFGQGWQPIDTAQADIFSWWNGEESFGLGRGARPLVEKVLAIDAYMTKYRHYLAYFTDPDHGNFSYANFLAKYNQIKSVIDPDGDNLTDGEVGDIDHTISVDGIDTYYDAKIFSVNDQLME